MYAHCALFLHFQWHCYTAGTWSEETSDCDVFPDSQWHGVPHPEELCPQRSSYKELHVGHMQDEGSLSMTYIQV